MEGPSLYLASAQLQPFKKKQVLEVLGNTKIGKERLADQKVKDIFSWGKHLVFQFPEFALRVHFMLFGSFEAVVAGESVTGDCQRSRETRLSLKFSNGEIKMFSCSLKYLESKDAKKDYDFSVDVLSDAWDPAKALKKLASYPELEIADVLLDQEIFAGVGNIIKNEILFQAKIHPQELIKNISKPKLNELVKRAEDFSWQFYEWRKKFVLRKNLEIYKRSTCVVTGDKIKRVKTGQKMRISYICPTSQKLKK